jgi:hypothetical protein
MIQILIGGKAITIEGKAFSQRILLQQTYQLSLNSSVSLLLSVPLISLTENKEYCEYKMLYYFISHSMLSLWLLLQFWMSHLAWCMFIADNKSVIPIADLLLQQLLMFLQIW